MSARLHGALSRDSKIKLASVVALSGRRTLSEGEMLELLLSTHFPNSVVTWKFSGPYCCPLRCDWQVAAEVVTYERLEWAINYLAPYKITGMDCLFPSLLQERRTYFSDPYNWVFKAWKCNEMHKCKHTFIDNLFVPLVLIPLLFNFVKHSEYIFMTG